MTHEWSPRWLRFYIVISGRQDNRRRQEKRTVVPVLLTRTFLGAYYFPGTKGGPQRGTSQHERRSERSYFMPRARVTTGVSPRADHQEQVMFRTIVISVLSVSACGMASGGMAQLAGWGPYYGLNWGQSPDRQAAFIGIFGGDFVGAYSAPAAGRHVPALVRRSWMGFGYARGAPDFAPTRFFLMASCPFWIPALLLAAYPILVLASAVRRRLRPIPGLCSKCHYNLTGLPEPRCPECGTAIE